MSMKISKLSGTFKLEGSCNYTKRGYVTDYAIHKGCIALKRGNTIYVFKDISLKRFDLEKWSNRVIKWEEDKIKYVSNKELLKVTDPKHLFFDIKQIIKGRGGVGKQSKIRNGDLIKRENGKWDLLTFKEMQERRDERIKQKGL